MACMRRKLVGLYFLPSLCATLAAIGTAETPAAPIRGLTLPLVMTYKSLPRRTPPAVEKQNARSPRPTIISVLICKKLWPLAVAPTVSPSMIVTMFIKAFCAVSLSLSTTPHSRKRLPSISMPRRGATDGSIKAQMRRTTTGNTIFSILLTLRSCFISTFLSFSVVRSFIIGG